MSACLLLLWWICTLAKMLLLAFPRVSALSLCNNLRTAEWIFMAFAVGPRVTVFEFWLNYDSASWIYVCFLHAFWIKHATYFWR